MTTNHWQDFLMGKNADNKVKRWGLELATYNMQYFTFGAPSAKCRSVNSRGTKPSARQRTSD